MKIEVFKNKAGRWQLRFRARNNRTWGITEDYASKSNAMRAARSLASTFDTHGVSEIVVLD